MNQLRWVHIGIAGALVLLLTGAAGIAARSFWQRSRPPTPLPVIERWADQRDWDRADAAITEYLARRPNHARACILAARIAAGMSDLERCATLLEKVPDGAPEKTEALTRLGQTWLELGHARRAEQMYREVLRRTESKNGSTLKYRRTALAELAALLHLEVRVQPAIDLVWEMFPDHPEKWRLLINLLRMHGSLPHPRMSSATIERYLVQDSNDVDARRALATYYALELLWPEAHREAQRCLEQAPDDAQCLEILLQCFLAQQQWPEMDQIFERPTLDHSSAVVWRLKAEREQAAVRWDEAKVCFRKALELKPRDSTTHYQFAFLLRLAGDDNDARVHQEIFQQLKTHENWLEEFLKHFPQGATDG
jgi:tetratricopeptide (TPR) repeat protein